MSQRIRRVYQITRTFLSYGLDEIVPARWLPWTLRAGRFGLFWIRNQHRDKAPGTRLRLALESLGPVWIKLGQMLSTRRDLLPTDIANELAMLQDKVKAFPGEQAQQLIEQALGVRDIAEVFADFSVQPLASASIAQVHTATLKSGPDAGTAVVIKVIRPDIRAAIDADLRLMETLARVIARHLPDGRRLKPEEVVNEYRKTLLDELDLLREAGNAIQLRRNFDNSPLLYIPKVYSDYGRHNVMVMERIDGIPVSDVETLTELGVNMKLLAERGVEVFFTQVFRDSFFHADMHPGNIFVSRENPSDPSYLGIDFGIVGTLNRDDKRYLAENFLAFFNRDYRKVAELHVDSGWVPAHINVEEFESAIRTVCEPIFNKPLAEISFGHVLVHLFNTARRFEMEVQPQLVLLQKTLLYVEGLGRTLYPQLDLWKTAKPFLEHWMQEQLGWRAVIRSIKENAPFWGEKLPEMPNLLYDVLRNHRAHMEQQQHLLTAIRNNQQQQLRTIALAVVSGALLLSTTILFVARQPTWLVALAAGATVLCGVGLWYRARIK